jgi:2-succinyl-5-enolpyruvyl-6-hydroxy-3-cyclohexene-1-carboxylate synthase
MALRENNTKLKTNYRQTVERENTLIHRSRETNLSRCVPTATWQHWRTERGTVFVGGTNMSRCTATWQHWRAERGTVFVGGTNLSRCVPTATWQHWRTERGTVFVGRTNLSRCAPTATWQHWRTERGTVFVGGTNLSRCVPTATWQHWRIDRKDSVCLRDTKHCEVPNAERRNSKRDVQDLRPRSKVHQGIVSM